MTRSDLTTLTLAALLLLLIAAPRSASDPALSQGGLTGQGRSGAPPASGTSLLRPAAPSVAKASERPDSVVTASDAPTHTAADVTIEGIASWVAPKWGHDYLAMRLPRGTRVTLSGPGGTWHAVVNDYGPARRTGRIADIAVGRWEDITGLDRSLGLARITVVITKRAAIALPETDQEEP